MYKTLATSSALVLVIFGIWYAFGTNSSSAHSNDTSLPRTTDDSTSTGPYRAPMRNAAIEDSAKVAGAYVVYLRPGYSYEEHKTAVSEAIDLDKHTHRVFDEILPNQIFYGAMGVSDLALDTIRGDPDVALVDHDVQIYLPEDRMAERPSGPSTSR